MAIQFLNTLQFNNNQSLNFRLQVLGADPTSDLEEGRLIFNDSSDGVVKVYTANGWKEVGGGVISLSTTNSTFVSLVDSGTSDDPSLEASLSATGLPGTGQSSYFLRGDNSWAIPPDTQGLTSVGLSIDVNDALDVTNTPLTSNGTIDLEWQGDSTQVVLGSGELDDYTDGTVTSVGLSIDNSAALGVAAASTPITSSGTLDLEWQGTSSEYVTADGGKVSIPSSDNYNYWTLSDGSNTTNISSQDTATFSGTSNEVDVAESGGTLTIGLPNDVTIGNDLTVSRDLTVTKTASVDSLGITNKGTSAATAGSDSSTTLATKGYVDSLTSGQLVYAGGYDASGDPPSGASVLQGYTYVVTVAGSGSGGTFWSTPLAIGDLIIALQDNPVDEGDWTEVNKNVTEATLTTIGEGNVNAGAGIDVSYSNGTATVSGEDSSPQNKGIITVTGGTGVTVSYNAGVADISADNNGTVTSVGATIDGDSIAISNSPVTGSGDLDFEFQGTSAQYIDGAGDLTTFPTIPQGDITEVTTTAPITGGGSSGSVDIAIDTATANKIGAGNVAAGTGIDVSVSNGTFTVSTDGTNPLGKRVALNTSTNGVSQQSGQPTGTTGWVIDVSDTDIFGNNVSDAIDVKVEVVTSAGQTVYPDVTRSNEFMTINFTNLPTTPGQGAYEALLTAI